MSQTTRVALVTGGAHRVGRAIVEALAADGFDIAFTYLSSSSEADELTGIVRDLGRKCVAIKTDLTSPTEAVKTIDAAMAEFSRLNVLVNNASIYPPSSLSQTTEAQLQTLWQIHVAAPMLLCQKFESRLRAAKGHVVNMVDILAERPWPEYMAYCTSKAGLLNLTLSLARALAPDVTVNGIAPGIVEWPKNYPEVEKEKYLKRVPLSRSGTPDDVVSVVRFLTQPNSYVTGQIIRLDGGRSLT
jgi:pteridine reductase